uniref:interleukin-20 receptor subunit alpha n=1 Tax=Scatophagus argus TaxID=75038 RepID=UPI001ED86152|nr:interleukin-20 receptor subunit alpha [Scatophagus argus]
MRTVFVLISLWILHCKASSSPPSPINVVFSSVNLRNILQWFPGNGTLSDTHFTVQYAIYGDGVENGKGRRANWRAVWRCTEIMRTWCDLSNETWDLEHGYVARVRAVSKRASSKWALTIRFDPKRDTSFGPPLVYVEIEDNSAIFSLKGPMRYMPNNHTPAVSMAALYPQMMYNLSIHNTRRRHTSHFTVASAQYKYRLMDYDTEYCFSAKAKFLSMPSECQSSAQYCITTPPDPVIGQLQMVVVGTVVPFVCICMLLMVGYILYHYLMGKGAKNPYMLNTPYFNGPPLTLPPEKLNLIHITVIKPSDTERDISEPTLPKQQHPEHVIWRAETPPVPEEPIDYGFVGKAPRIDVRGEERETERRHDGGKDGNNLKGKHQKWTPTGSCEKKEWRGENTHSAGVYAPQTKSYHSQRSTHTCSQTHMLIHMEMSPLVQVPTWVNSVPLSQTQAPLLSFKGAPKAEVDRLKGGEFSGLFGNKFPQNGLFHFPLNLPSNKEGEMGEKRDGKVRVRADGKIDAGVEEGSERERVPLLLAYASQKPKDMFTSCAEQSGSLPDDYGILSLAPADKIDEMHDDEHWEEEEEEEEAIFLDWDPETRKLVLPELPTEFIEEEGELDERMQGEKGRQKRVGGEEEAYAMRSKLMLENVFVRQGSEEEAEAQRELERNGERGWEADDILTKWDLVISMDQ